MSGPSVRTVAPEANAPSTISTARSTPKQNPYSSASRTCILTVSRRLLTTADGFPSKLAHALGRRGRGDRLGCGRAVAAAPLVAQPLGRREAVVNPPDVLVGEPADAAPEVFLELAQLPRRVRGEHGERRVAQKAHRVADGVA